VRTQKTIRTKHAQAHSSRASARAVTARPPVEAETPAGRRGTRSGAYTSDRHDVFHMSMRCVAVPSRVRAGTLFKSWGTLQPLHTPVRVPHQRPEQPLPAEPPWQPSAERRLAPHRDHADALPQAGEALHESQARRGQEHPRGAALPQATPGAHRLVGDAQRRGAALSCAGRRLLCDRAGLGAGKLTTRHRSNEWLQTAGHAKDEAGETPANR
jgi:hypothetical protein